jgi:glycogen operon protein
MSRLHPALEEGRAEPFGAQARDGGVNFAVFSAHASRIEVCIFDADGTRELKRYALHGPDDGVWHGFLPGAAPGLVYGLRAHGPHQPEHGHRFNPHKLLLDPYAREIVGRFDSRAEHYGYEVGHPDGVLSFDRRDNAAWALKARVAAPAGAAPGTSNRPRHATRDLVIYEAHVKGLTIAHPAVPPEQRGSYAALAHPAVIAHLHSLGVTTLELLPLQYHLDEPFLAAKGLVNHWGYNTIGFFAPDPRFASAAARGDPAAVAAELKRAIAALHDAGIEVILDVVYNHTPEGNEFGPTVSFRGLDQRAWYHLAHDDATRMANLTGCGNALNVAHPRVTQFVLDSLRHWVQDYGIDGFRFDLAPVLGRQHPHFNPHAPFFTALAQDPMLAGVRLIAEAWDAGPEGYQVGRFPGRWLEWNDKFRDSVRRYWLGPWLPQRCTRGEMARRFSASSDLFHHGGRRPTASINFVACHDGFTLADVTRFTHKHNHANGEDNRDGRSDELCADTGPAAPRVQRAMLATTLLAQGTPMLNAGDEGARSQGGNNNAWNQDNPTGWMVWPPSATVDAELIAFVGRVAALRRQHALLRCERWFGQDPQADHGPTLQWRSPAGHALHHHEWHDADDAAFAGLLSAAGDTSLLIAFNPAAAARRFALPAGVWQVALDSAGVQAEGSVAADAVDVAAHALLVLQATNP